MSNEVSTIELKKFYQKIRKNRGYMVAFNNLTRAQRSWLKASYYHHKRLESQLENLQNRIAGSIYQDSERLRKELQTRKRMESKNEMESTM